MIYIVLIGSLLVVGFYMVSPMLLPGKRVKSHNGVPKSVFVTQLSDEGVPESISSAVFDFYKKKGHTKQFNPSPDMDINGIFEEGPEDIDDAAKSLLQHLHLKAPSESDRESWSGRDVRTAGDLARWLYWASTHQPS
jgi:hypothetical protein